MADPAVRDIEPATDFFISYHPADSDWAQWIGNELEEADYRVFLQEWDVAAGSNSVIAIDAAMRRSKRTIAVVTQSYLNAETNAPQWTARFAEDPQGVRRQLIPVLVAAVDLSGSPFAQITPINLVGLSAAEAREALLAGAEGRRTRRTAPPEFPGSDVGMPVAGVASVLWRRSEDPIRTRWRADDVGAQYGNCTIELHTIPVGGPDLDARTLRALPAELTMLGRRAGLFDSSAAVYEDVNEDRAEVKSLGDRYSSLLGDRGIAVSRQHAVTSWTPLPHDFMGSVFDEAHVASQLADLLRLSALTGVNSSGRVAVAVSVEPIARLQVGSVDDVGRRSSAQLLYTSVPADLLRLEATHTVPIAAIEDSAGDVAEELAARVSLRLKSIGRF